MALSKRLRFEILKRDGFRCLYCGASPIAGTLTVGLHADHVDPKSKGGADEPANLVTACADCNQGKSDVPLERKRLNSRFGSEEEREHAEQIREYLALQREIAAAKRDAEALVLEHWQERIGAFPWQLPRYVPGAVKDFGVHEVLDFVDIVAAKGISNPTSQVKYFCGILRKRRNPEKQLPQPPTRTPDEKQFTAANLRDAEWKTLAMVVQAYWRHRVFGSSLKDPTEVLRRAVGRNKENFPALDLEAIFGIIDDVAWVSPSYEDDAQEQTFFSLIEKAITDRQFIPQADMTFETQSEKAYALVNELWNALVGSEIRAEDSTIDGLASWVRDYGIGGIVSAMLQITEERWPPLEREAALRRELIRAISRSSSAHPPPNSPLALWPEWDEIV